MSDDGSSVAVDADEERRRLALRLAVDLIQGPDATSGHATRAARVLELYLRDGTVQR